jgi:hypothetical protein
MGAPRVDYEWVAEPTDAHGDIVECLFADTLEQARRYQADAETPACPVALVRHEYTEIDGELARYYAYLRDDGTLPDNFSEPGTDDGRGPRIPQRFKQEAR